MNKETPWPSSKRVTRIFKKILTPRLGILEAQLLSAISPLAADDKLESVMQKLDSMQEILVRIDSRNVERGNSEVFNESDRKLIEVIYSIAKETNSTVKRINERDVKRGKRQRDIELQEFCFNIWNSAKQNNQIQRCRNGKVKHLDVFNYYKRELNSRGITKIEEFSSLLKHRSNRLSIHASRTRR